MEFTDADKIEKALTAFQNEFTKEFEKEFTKEEVEYLNKLFSHKLIIRVLEFQTKFVESKKSEQLIQEALKVKLPTPEVNILARSKEAKSVGVHP